MEAAYGNLNIGIFFTVATAIRTFGGGVGRIVLDNVHCTGFESRLIYCLASYNHDCTHSEDAGVSCRGATGKN